MKEERKIPIKVLQKQLQAQLHYKNPDAAFRTLLLCWQRHPRFKHPNLNVLATRIRTDGYGWLREEEIPSFEAYCGYSLQ